MNREKHNAGFGVAESGELIEVSGLQKSFEDVEAVKGITLMSIRANCLFYSKQLTGNSPAIPKA
ncbi:MAG: hypothetical protein ACOCTU_06490 [Bacteroidota bacterium]